MNRWEWLLEQRPRPIMEQLLDEVAGLLAKDLEGWPPKMDLLDPATGGSFAPLFRPEAQRPNARVYVEAFKLARWELARDLDAYDDYMRNQRYLEMGLGAADRLALLFLSRWLLEQALSLGEATEGRVNRAQLSECLSRAERTFLSRGRDNA
jgi:hypothetical protein